MNITREQLLLYAITDRSWLKGEIFKTDLPEVAKV